MSEFLVAKLSSTDPKLTQAGDIIDVRDDGFNWSRGELAAVVKLPSIPIFLASPLYREGDREIRISVDSNRTQDTAGTLSVRRDGVEFATFTIDDVAVLIKARSRSSEDVGNVTVHNSAGEELQTNTLIVDFNERRFKIVGETIVDKLA